MSSAHRNAAVVEAVDRKTFASMLGWPGWSRSGKSEEAAIASLLVYSGRYRKVIQLAERDCLPTSIEVIDRIPGSGATAFGVPDHIHQVDYQPVNVEDTRRLIAILDACWSYFNDVRGRVSSRLRKGPRGGGRDRDQIVEHVVMADRGYARRIGVRTNPFDPFDDAARAAHTQDVYKALLSRRHGNVEGKEWPMQYIVRRMAWHILDHAWEMEDKDLSQPEGAT